MNRRHFISLLAGAAGAPLVPWRGLIEPVIVLPARPLPLMDEFVAKLAADWKAAGDRVNLMISNYITMAYDADVRQWRVISDGSVDQSGRFSLRTYSDT